ncbi:MAG: MCE family protein [Sedimentisphaerales bacterium]|nr:MCE family protein [Sedimentisphaerales bacterium]
MSDYEKSQKMSNTIVGLFVIIGLVALVWLIFKFNDLPGFVSEMDSFEVFVQFPSAPGAQKDTPVQFCGYQIGRVAHVMAPEIKTDLNTGQKYYQTVIVLSIDNKYTTIPSNVNVKMMMRGLGSSYIELKEHPGIPPVPLDPNRPETKFLCKGIYLQGSTGMTSEFFPEESQEKLSELINGVSVFIENANKIIGNIQNQNNLEATLANLTVASEQAKSTLEAIEILANTGTDTLAHTNVKLDEIVDVVAGTSKDIQEFVTTGTSFINKTDERSEDVVKVLINTVEEIGETSSQLRLIMEKINTGQGTIAKFVNDPMLYDKLVQDTEQLDEVLGSMKALIDKIEKKGLSKVWSGSK